jgi:hypothetical protein
MFYLSHQCQIKMCHLFSLYGQQMEIFWKKVYFHLLGIDRSRSGIIMRILPDPDPDLDPETQQWLEVSPSSVGVSDTSMYNVHCTMYFQVKLQNKSCSLVCTALYWNSRTIYGG